MALVPRTREKTSGKSFIARGGIEKLKRSCDTVLVVLNDKLLEIFEDLNILEAFAHADDVLMNAAKSVAEVITKSGKVNADFKDVKKVLSNAGQAVMSQATAQGPNRAKDVIEKALDSPLLNNRDIKGAERIVLPLLLFHIGTTILPLFFLPNITWQSFMVPTLEGQYIIKNLVIIATAIGLVAHLHPLPKKVDN